MIEQFLGKKAQIEFQPRHPADVPATWADISKAKELLSWRPLVSIEEGIQRTNGIKSMIHETAEVSPKAQIGKGSRIWHYVQIREGAKLGENCIVGKGAYIDFDVVIGSNVKIQNGAFIYHGVTIEDGVFIGPHVCLTNDKIPRAITLDGNLKTDGDWEEGTILVKYGASIGAGAVVLPNVTIGKFAMIGAGAIVTKSVPDHGIVVGNPARLVGFACKCGRKLTEVEQKITITVMKCNVCQLNYDIPNID